MFWTKDRIIFFLLLGIGVLSCRPDRLASREKEVLDLHDEVMPHMEEMKAMRRQLKGQSFTSTLDSIQSRKTSYALHEGDSLMWVWMYQYTPVGQLKDSLSLDQQMDYLDRQYDKIKIVNEKIKQAMSDARLLLSEN